MNNRFLIQVQTIPYLLDVSLLALSECTLGGSVLLFPFESTILVLSYETIEASDDGFQQALRVDDERTAAPPFFLVPPAERLGALPTPSLSPERWWCLLGCS